VRLLKYGDAYYISDVLCAFRVTSANWSSRLGRLRYENYKDMIKIIRLLDYADVGLATHLFGIARARLNEYLRRIFYIFFRR